MAVNAPDVRFSPAWWMAKLADRKRKELLDSVSRDGLTARPGLNTLAAWLDNDPPLPEGAPSWQPAYQAFHKDSRTNVADLTVRSAANRMTALGFRTGASGDENGDEVAAQVWAQNQMAVEQVDLFTDMLGLRAGYTMVTPPRDDAKLPIITSEDPRAVATAHDPARRSVVRAAMKTLHDPDNETDECWIYLPPGPLYDPVQVTAYRASRPAGRDALSTLNLRYAARDWQWDAPVKLPTTRVPFVKLENRRGMAEFEPHLSILGRINRITLQRMLIGEIQAFRQRAVKGLPRVWPEGHPLAGQEIDYEGIFEPGPGALWQVPEGVDFWESKPIDLRPLLDEERLEYRTLSALIGIPVSYFNPDDTNGSAEGASLQREALIYRVEDRQTIAEAGLNMTMSHAFEMMGDTARQDVSKIETIWAPVERLSLGERYQAAVLAKNAGMPQNAIYREVLRLTPRQQRAVEDDAMTDLILGRNPQATPQKTGATDDRQGTQTDPQAPNRNDSARMAARA